MRRSSRCSSTNHGARRSTSAPMKHRVEPGAFELHQRVARMAGRRRAPRRPGAYGAAPRASRATVGRQMMRRIDQEAGRAHRRTRRGAGTTTRTAHRARLHRRVRVGDIQRVRGAARIDQRVVVRVLDVPVRMLGAQQVLTRDPIRRLRAAGAARWPCASWASREIFGALARSQAARTAAGNRPRGAESRRRSRPRTRRRAHDRSPCRRHARTSAAMRRAVRRGGRRRSRVRKGRRGVHGAGVRAAVNDAGSPAPRCACRVVSRGARAGRKPAAAGLSFYMTAGYCMRMRGTGGYPCCRPWRVVIGFGKRHAGVAAHHRTVFDPVRERRR